MNRWTRYLPLLLLAAAVMGFAAGPAIRGTDGIPASALGAEEEMPQAGFGELSRQDRMIRQIFTEIWRSYYQEVDIEEVALGGLKGMMAQLDPYSEFYVEEQDTAAVADLENTLTGTYSGIGATIGPRGGDLSIIAPMKQSPAERSGLLAGDIILAIDGQPSRHFSASKAASLIKGPRGTPVTLTIGREGFPDAIEITIIRDDIEVNDVAAAIFAEPGIAYIEIARFSRNTGRFLIEAIDELERQQRIEGLILDLRGNPGGLLDESLAVVEPFLPAGDLVVYTQGRISQMNARFSTRERQRYAGRMAVLVNSASASASEIVAGAFQDLDRAVIVGQTTFGKGLVQSVAELEEGTYLRLTTGEYFTPSGRNLQRPFVRDDRGFLTLPSPSAPDTTTHPEYRSRNGRTVTGGGGVVPDIKAQGLTGDILLFELKFLDGMLLRYVNNYVNTRGIKEGDAVVVDNRMLEDFKRWCIEQEFTFETPTEMELRNLRRTAEAENVAEGMAAEINALETAIEREKERLWERDRDKIALELRREFTTRLSGYGPGQLEYMKEDQQFQSALRVLRDTAAYSGLLTGDAAGRPPRRTGAGGPPDSAEPTAKLHPEDPEQAVPVP